MWNAFHKKNAASDGYSEKLKGYCGKTEASHINSPMWNAFHKKNNIINQGRLS